MQLTPEQKAAFIEAAKPLVKWLNENCHPHMVIYVENDGAELLESQHTFRTQEFLKD